MPKLLLEPGLQRYGEELHWTQWSSWENSRYPSQNQGKQQAQCCFGKRRGNCLWIWQQCLGWEAQVGCSNLLKFIGGHAPKPQEGIGCHLQSHSFNPRAWFEWWDYIKPLHEEAQQAPQVSCCFEVSLSLYANTPCYIRWLSVPVWCYCGPCNCWD